MDLLCCVLCIVIAESCTARHLSFSESFTKAINHSHFIALVKTQFQHVIQHSQGSITPLAVGGVFFSTAQNRRPIP